MKRELKPTEHEAVLHAVMAGDRVKATSIYLSATEGNLTDAQKFVKALWVEIKDQRNSGDGAAGQKLKLRRANREWTLINANILIPQIRVYSR